VLVEEAEVGREGAEEREKDSEIDHHDLKARKPSALGGAGYLPPIGAGALVLEVPRCDGQVTHTSAAHP
jgi:hypothetical protein